MYNLSFRVIKTIWNKWDKGNWIFAVHNSIIPINNLQNGFFLIYAHQFKQLTTVSVARANVLSPVLGCPIVIKYTSGINYTFVILQKIVLLRTFHQFLHEFGYERRVEHPNSRICVADEWWEIWAPSPVLSCPVLAGAWNCVNSISSLELTTGQNATHCAATLH